MTDMMMNCALVEKGADADVLREMIGFAADGAGGGRPYRRRLGQKSKDRLAQRNGYRERDWETRAGTIEPRIPRLRTGSYFPSFLVVRLRHLHPPDIGLGANVGVIRITVKLLFLVELLNFTFDRELYVKRDSKVKFAPLEPRRIAEKALTACDPGGLHPGHLDAPGRELVKSLGMSGISKSQVSRLCEEIDERVKTFLDRPVEGDWPYLWIDATYLKVRQNGRIVSVAVIVAVGVNSDGRREVLGVDIGPSEAEAFWTGFLRKLARRGLRGVKLVLSDAHEAIKASLAKVLTATWQRCRVHFMRNALAHAGKNGRRGGLRFHRHSVCPGRHGG